jgi:hypothetical protein
VFDLANNPAGCKRESAGRPQRAPPGAARFGGLGNDEGDRRARNFVRIEHD